MLPGPASTQLEIYMGCMRGGILGAIVGGTTFIMITLLSYLYFNYGSIPEVKGILYGVNAVVISLISSSLYKMSKKFIDDVTGIKINTKDQQ